VTKELNILIQSVRLVFLQEGAEILKTLYEDEEVDWEKVKVLSAYHRIRPVVFEAARQLNCQNSTVQRFALYSRDQSLLNLLSLKELDEVLSSFRDEKILAVPYKGMVFLQKLYGGKTLRESSDLDIVVDKGQAVAAMLHLQKLGYSLKLDLKAEESTFRNLIQNAQGRQVSWSKRLASGNAVHIDLHWGVNEEYHSYTISTASFFEGAWVGVLTREQVLLPSEAALFAMILNHNGGRECWTRIKDVVDLLVFLQKYPTFDADSASKGYSMHTIYLQGQSLINAYFRCSQSSSPMDLKFLRYWSVGSRDWVLPKLRFVWLYKAMQDSPLSTREIIQHFLSHFVSKYFKTDIYGYPFEGKYKVFNLLTQGLRKRYARS
jgi:hypothetical protein